MPLAIAAVIALVAGVLAVSGAASPAHAVNTASITGHLYGGTTATPIANGEVDVFIDGQTFSDVTDANGAYSLTGLPAGTATLGFYTAYELNYLNEYWIDAPSIAGATYFALGEGQAITGRDATLAQGSTIQGFIRDDQNHPIEGAYAVVYRNGASDSSETLVNFAMTNSNGFYSVNHVPLGQIKVGFTATSGSPLLPNGGLNVSGAAYAGEWYSNAYSWSAAQYFELIEPITVQAIHGSLKPLSFADVPDASSPFFDAIGWMKSSNISTGTPQPSGLPLYKPSDSVSRQALASFLYKLSGDSFTAPTTASFADVAVGSQFFTAIEWMKSKGYSTGTPQSSGLPLYKPIDAVSRQAMATFLSRFAGAILGPVTEQSFSDVPINSGPAAAIQWMKESGISTGTPAEPLPLYKPADPVSRQAMALFLFRTDNYLNTVG